MKTMNSVNIHDIAKIEISTEVFGNNKTHGSSFTVKKYRFTDSQKNVFTVAAFLNDEFSVLDEINESTES